MLTTAQGIPTTSRFAVTVDGVARTVTGGDAMPRSCLTGFAHHGGRLEGQKLLERADSLATELHELIERSWRGGQLPSDARRRRIETLVEDLRGYATIGARQQAIPEEPEE
ncbi:MAG TPA: hypothetical protein VFX16_33200 [Pseudonocardiaceae bacterium]|nr:hypothetical protein [Pseudonocardiaceae bacterium]